jgi:hypothetical protein
MPKIIEVPNRDVTISFPDETPDEVIKSYLSKAYPRNGYDVSVDLASSSPSDYIPSKEDYLKYEAYMKSVSDSKSVLDEAIGFVKGVGSAVPAVLGTLADGGMAGAKLAANGEFSKGVASVFEGVTQGVANPILAAANSTNPDSPFFKARSLLTGTGSPDERYVQFLSARNWQDAIKRAEEGKQGIFFKEGEYDPQFAQGIGMVADAGVIAGGAMAALRGAGLVSKTSRVLDIAEKIGKAESRIAGGVEAVAGAAETAARRASYLTDWNRGAEAYASSIMQDARDAAGKIFDTDPNRAASIIADATAHAEQVKTLAFNGSNWVKYVTNQAAKYGVIGGMFGSGHIEPLIAKAMAAGGDGAFKFAEALSGVAKEAAGYVAAEGPGQISGLERVASTGSTAGRRRLAEMLAKYGPSQGAIDALKPAVASTMLGSMIGGGFGYGMEGTGEAAGAGAGSGATLGALAGAMQAPSAMKAAKETRVIADFVKDLRARPEVAEFWSPFETQVVDPDGSVSGVVTNFERSTVNDRAARMKMAEAYSADNLARVLNITKMAEDSGARVIFHQDDFSPPQLNGTKYNGVTVHTGTDGTPTVFLNVDRMKPSTAAHEVWHAFESDEFNKIVLENLFGDLSQFDAGEFAKSDIGKQFSRFVTEYSNKIQNGEEWRNKAFRALGDDNLNPTDRAVMLSDAVSEFGAYYFENWLQGKRPDIALAGKIPNVWSTALQKAKGSLFKMFGMEAANAHGATLDSASGTFYKDGRRISIAGLDELSKRFIEESKNPRVQKAVSDSFIPTPKEPDPAGGMLNGDWTKRLTGKTIDIEVEPVPASSEADPLLLEQPGTSWLRNRRITEEQIQAKAAEYERAQKRSRMTPEEKLADIRGEAPKPQEQQPPAAASEPVKPTQPTKKKTTAPEAVVERFTSGAPRFEPTPERVAKPTVIDIAPEPRAPIGTIPEDAVVLPRSFDDNLRTEGGWKVVNHAWLKGKLSKEQKLKAGIKQSDKAAPIKRELVEKIYTPVYEDFTRLPRGNDGSPVKILIDSPEDPLVKKGIIPGNMIEGKFPKTIVFTDKPTLQQVAAISQIKDPQTGNPLYTRDQIETLKQLVKDRQEGKTSKLDIFAERSDLVPNQNEARVYYPSMNKEVIVTGIYSSATSAPKIGIIDLSHIKANIRKQFNDPQFRSKLNFKGDSAAEIAAIEASLQAYMQNLSNKQAIPSAELLGGGKVGAFRRDVLQRAFQISRQDVEKVNAIENPLPRVTSKTESGQIGREHGVPYQWVRIDRLVRAFEGKKFTFDQGNAYTRILANFQPADALKESLGAGSVNTDTRTGFRLVSKDGKSQRLFDPNGKLVGVFASEEDAVNSLDKMTLAAFNKRK